MSQFAHGLLKESFQQLLLCDGGIGPGTLQQGHHGRVHGIGGTGGGGGGGCGGRGRGGIQVEQDGEVVFGETAQHGAVFFCMFVSV